MSYGRTDPAEPGCAADRFQRPLLTSLPLPAAADTWRSATQTETERGYASGLLLISGFANIPRMNWMISYYNERLEQDILRMPAGLLARYLRYVDLMTVHGPNLGMPHSRALGNGLLELRLQAQEGIGRVLYCTLAAQRIVILHQFIKKSQKIPPRDLRLARQRMQEVQDADARRTQGKSSP